MTILQMWCAVMWPGSSPQRRVLWVCRRITGDVIFAERLIQLVIFPYMVYLPCLISGTLVQPHNTTHKFMLMSSSRWWFCSKIPC
jgi:hypothetical protein